MKNITINYEKQVIEITSKFAKAAGAYGSDAFKKLAEVRRDFPGYKVDVVQETKRHNGQDYKGLNYKNMAKYIKAHDEDGSKMKTFNELRGEEGSEFVKAVSYGEMRKWFLKTFPEIENARKSIEGACRDIEEIAA